MFKHGNSLFSHIVQMSDESDAKQTLTASPLENWWRPPGCPHTTWREISTQLKFIEINEPLPQRSNWCGSESSTLEIDVYVWRYALIVMHAKKWMMNDV